MYSDVSSRLLYMPTITFSQHEWQRINLKTTGYSHFLRIQVVLQKTYLNHPANLFETLSQIKTQVESELCLTGRRYTSANWTVT